MPWANDMELRTTTWYFCIFDLQLNRRTVEQAQLKRVSGWVRKRLSSGVSFIMQDLRGVALGGSI